MSMGSHQDNIVMLDKKGRYFMEVNERRQMFLHIMPPLTHKVCKTMQECNFFNAPASTKYHGNYEGGLFDHSLEVVNQLVDLTEKLGLQWSRPESPYIVGMFHDICKMDKYIRTDEGYEYNDEILLDGHGVKSVIMLQTMMELTDEEIMCIRYHMGAYETNDWKQFGLAIQKYPNVLYMHMADMIASKVVGI